LLRILAATAGIAVLALATASPCAGWEATPQERQDCCERRHCRHLGEFDHGGASQSDADQCCVRSERGTADRTEQSRLVPIVQAVSSLDGTVEMLLDQDVPLDALSLHPPGPVPIYLLHSVFQI
jgi:hypothetical protein